MIDFNNALANRALTDQQVVAIVDGRQVTRAEITAAFDRVVNQENWKGSIRRMVDVNPNDAAGLAVLTEAVIFFTGSVPVFEYIGTTNGLNRYLCTAAGYYRTIGA